MPLIWDPLVEEGLTKSALLKALRIGGQNLGILPTPEKQQLMEDSKSVMPQLADPAKSQLVGDAMMGMGTGNIGMAGAIKAYHGTTNPNITQFTGKGGGQLGRGDYFTPNFEDAVKWSGSDNYNKWMEHQFALRDNRASHEYVPSVYEVELKWPDAAREAADPFGVHHLQPIELGSKGSPSYRDRITKLDKKAPGQVSPFGADEQYLIRNKELINILRRHDIPSDHYTYKPTEVDP